MAKENNIPSTVKFPTETLGKLKEAARLTGLPVQEIIRMCAGIGLGCSLAILFPYFTPTSKASHHSGSFSRAARIVSRSRWV